MCTRRFQRARFRLIALHWRQALRKRRVKKSAEVVVFHAHFPPYPMKTIVEEEMAANYIKPVQLITLRNKHCSRREPQPGYAPLPARSLGISRMEKQCGSSTRLRARCAAYPGRAPRFMQRLPLHDINLTPGRPLQGLSEE